jgi:NADH dehydrogenase
MGGWVAKDILAGLKGEESPPFHWMDLGSMAVIGPWYAVADLRGWHVTGLTGWVLWALAHLAFIPTQKTALPSSANGCGKLPPASARPC